MKHAIFLMGFPQHLPKKTLCLLKHIVHQGNESFPAISAQIILKNFIHPRNNTPPGFEPRAVNTATWWTEAGHDRISLA